MIRAVAAPEDSILGSRPTQKCKTPPLAGEGSSEAPGSTTVSAVARNTGEELATHGVTTRLNGLRGRIPLSPAPGNCGRMSPG